MGCLQSLNLLVRELNLIVHLLQWNFDVQPSTRITVEKHVPILVKYPRCCGDMKTFYATKIIRLRGDCSIEGFRGFPPSSFNVITISIF